jgi:hypothetical protein
LKIGVKIARTLNFGGLAIAGCFILAILAKMVGLSTAEDIAVIGIILTAATPVAGVMVAGYQLYRSGEKKYALYAMILLILMAVAGLWRFLS